MVARDTRIATSKGSAIVEEDDIESTELVLYLNIHLPLEDQEKPSRGVRPTGQTLAEESMAVLLLLARQAQKQPSFEE